MSDYLSRIATRNVPHSIPMLKPSAPIAPVSDADPFREDINDQPVVNPATQNSTFINPVPQIGPLVNPVNEPPVKSIKPAVIKAYEKPERPEAPPQNESAGTKYLTKHIERLVFNEDNYERAPVEPKNIAANYIVPEENAGSEKKTDKIYFGNEDRDIFKKYPPLEIQPETLQEPGNKKEAFIQKNKLIDIEPRPSEDRTVVTPKPVIGSSLKGEKLKLVKPVANTQNVTVLSPAKLSSAAPVTKAVKAVPKLVIGKITVEVLPPVIQKPNKIITRVVQASPFADNSKTSKPSFGLGQL